MCIRDSFRIDTFSEGRWRGTKYTRGTGKLTPARQGRCLLYTSTQGLSAPTAGIAKEAGVANGSLFTYFETKTDLFNQLYLELKIEMASTATKNLRTGAEPVSYTHLDVYKRQPGELNECQTTFVFTLPVINTNNKDKICLLYTSRCV